MESTLLRQQDSYVKRQPLLSLDPLTSKPRRTLWLSCQYVLRFRGHPDLMMLACSIDRLAIFARHVSFNQGHRLAHLIYMRVHMHRDADGDAFQIANVERPRDTTKEAVQ